MRETVIRRGITIIGSLYGLYGTAVVFGFVGILVAGMQIGVDGIVRFMTLSQIPRYFIFLGLVSMPITAVCCFSLLYSFLQLKRWGHI